MLRRKAPVNVAVVVLNWRLYDRTKRCLESLRSFDRSARAYLVDQASDPSAVKRLAEACPDVAIIPLEQNLGFAEGMNVGMDRALKDGATHLLLLNNDTTVTPPLLDRLLAVFDVHEDAGIVGPSIRFPVTDRGGESGASPAGRIQSMGIDVNRYTGRIGLRSHQSAAEDIYPYPHKVDALPGAAMLLDADVVKTAGMFDPGYFCYFEDVEFCLRARQRGYSSYVVPGAVVYHEGGATLGLDAKRHYYALRNQLWVLEDHGAQVTTPLRHLRSSYVVSLHLAQILREGPGLGAFGRESGGGLAERVVWALRGARDYRRGRFGGCPGT